MSYDTTWNCAAGKACDMDAAVCYDPWDDTDDSANVDCRSNLTLDLEYPF